MIGLQVPLVIPPVSNNPQQRARYSRVGIFNSRRSALSVLVILFYPLDTTSCPNRAWVSAGTYRPQTLGLDGLAKAAPYSLAKKALAAFTVRALINCGVPRGSNPVAGMKTGS